MTAATVIEQFAATREQLDSVCELLVYPAPEVLDRCSGLLESAGRQIADCQPQIAAMRGDPAAIEAAWRLRRSFVTADKLLQSAARFHANWIAIRGALTGGYTVRGQAAPIRHAGRICIEA